MPHNESLSEKSNLQEAAETNGSATFEYTDEPKTGLEANLVLPTKYVIGAAALVAGIVIGSKFKTVIAPKTAKVARDIAEEAEQAADRR